MRDVYEAITQKIIDKLNEGEIPWQRPWKIPPGQVHQNFVSKKPYRGINALMTGFSGYACPYWVSFKQAQDLGGNIRKGEKSPFPVVFWKFLNKLDGNGQPIIGDNGKPKQVPFIRYTNVFNLTQTEGIPIPDLKSKENVSPEPSPDTAAVEAAKKLVDDSNICPIRNEGAQACYSPIRDDIRMPPIETFVSKEDYYHILFHEMGHATGHPSRLARPEVEPGNIRFGKEPYAREELVAELTACFLSNETGIIEHVKFDNPTAYIQNWLKVLKGDTKMVVQASGLAQKAADLIRGVPLTPAEEIGEGIDPIPTNAPEFKTFKPRTAKPSGMRI